MGKVYGYARISRKEQSVDRQIRNIRAAYSDAIVVQEAFTGTKVEGRVKFERLLQTVKEGDSIIFDSVSRMSRNATEGVTLYEMLYNRGVRLVFLKEPGIDTDVYKKVLADAVPMTGTSVDIILAAVNEYLRTLRKEQITLAFKQAQKEVDDLHQRTREGLMTARLNGKQVGGVAGKKLTTKKSLAAKDVIKAKSKDFDGCLEDTDVIKLCGISRNSYYRYKRELRMAAQ